MDGEKENHGNRQIDHEFFMPTKLTSGRTNVQGETMNKKIHLRLKRSPLGRTRAHNESYTIKPTAIPLQVCVWPRDNLTKNSIQPNGICVVSE